MTSFSSWRFAGLHLFRCADRLCWDLQVWDADIFTSDDIIGVAAVDIHTLASGPVHHDVELIGEVGEPCGRLLFDLEVIQVMFWCVLASY